MLIVLRKTYTISVTIQEGNDEFWEGLRGRSGADEVVQEVRDAIAERGFTDRCFVRLEKFEERAPLAG